MFQFFSPVLEARYSMFEERGEGESRAKFKLSITEYWMVGSWPAASNINGERFVVRGIDIGYLFPVVPIPLSVDIGSGCHEPNWMVVTSQGLTTTPKIPSPTPTFAHQQRFDVCDPRVTRGQK